MKDIDILLARSEQACQTLKLISNPNRMRILCGLSMQEMAVGDMEDMLQIRQPTLSRELGHLREAGVVTTRKQSRVVFYQLSDARIARLLDVLCDHFDNETILENQNRELEHAE